MVKLLLRLTRGKLFQLASISIFSIEYFLVDYMSKFGNLDSSNVVSVFSSSGYRDIANFTLDALPEGYIENRQLDATLDNNEYTYDFVLIPYCGFLASPHLLLNGCELRINLDRADPKCSFLRKDSKTTTLSKIEIEDCYATVDYISSPQLREYFERVSMNPIIYEYDDLNVMTLSIPQHETHIRFDNIRTPQKPSYLFAGILESGDLNGVYDKPSTSFQLQKVKEMNILFNGNVCPGYPIKSDKRYTKIFHQYVDVTNRLYNGSSGKTFDVPEFGINLVWSHFFEGEDANGSLSIDFTLEEAYTQNKTLVIWTVSDAAVSIDDDHVVTRL